MNLDPGSCSLDAFQVDIAFLCQFLHRSVLWLWLSLCSRVSQEGVAQISARTSQAYSLRTVRLTT